MEREKSRELVEKKIQDILFKNPGGLEIKSISWKLGLSTHTTGRYLDVMSATNKIYRREIGTARIHYHLKFARAFFNYRPKVKKNDTG